MNLEQMVRLGYIEHAAMLACHEAAHAAAACFAGLRIAKATIDEPARLGGGVVRLEHTEPTLAHLLATLAGPLVSGTPLQWPPADLGDGSDEANAAILVYLLDIDAGAWRDADMLTREMLEFPAVQRARRALSGALYERGFLDGAEVRRIYNEATAPSVSTE
jgi:hypothetical protein